MRRTVSRLLVTACHSKALHEAITARSPWCQESGSNFLQSMQFSQFSSTDKISRWRGHNFVLQRLYSAQPEAEDENVPIESELRRKAGWLLKILAAVTITYVSFNAFPIMGDSLIWQSVALVRSNDPFMKRSGASRITMIATNDRRRKNFVEVGGVVELAKMLESAPDDKTRREAVKALVSLCECEVAVEALHATGAEGLLKSLSQGSSDSEVESRSLVLLQKLEQWKGGAK
ncbi:hypothetical protein GOP47_0029052 [Adiantum capillus-veneris]|nr:hypothetical protein GOP47_0029052 [Adiantum capillus-veneris]